MGGSGKVRQGKAGGATLAERFLAFHEARPDVYRAFRDHARRLRFMGHRHLSAQYICDYLSFESRTDGRPDSAWKINHDFGPFYARMLMAEDESFGRAFERRRSVADEVDVLALVRAA